MPESRHPPDPSPAPRQDALAATGSANGGAKGADPVVRLRALFDAAVSSVSPAVCLRPHLAQLAARHRPGRVAVLAVGKAGASMFAAVRDGLDRTVSGLVITPRDPGPGDPPPDATVASVQAGHPIPDSGSLLAGRRALALARSLGPGDHLLALVSGGGSALMCAPATGVSLAGKQALTRSLLHCGAAISEINGVRKHLSRVKGGRLALAAFPATVETLAISDIPGDDPQLIASGPTLPDPTTLAEARAVLERYRLTPPTSILRALGDPANESLKPGHPLASGLRVTIVARAADALAAAQAMAAQAGVQSTILGDQLEGEARRLGAHHADLARAMAPGDAPHLLLSGGETTVTVAHRAGRGGPNLEYLLGLVIALDGAEGIYAIACDTDGQDGTEPVAGAVVTPSTLRRARELGLDARTLLSRNDSHAFFAALGDLVVTGPTRTNVNDFRAIWIDARPSRRL